jgi:hypothetical protein
MARQDADLAMVAKVLDIPAAELIRACAEDPISGYNPDLLDGGYWQTGCIYEHEGRLLYGLVRVLQPEVIVEVGRFRGCSTAHLAAACAANDKGYVYSFDVIPYVPRIPAELEMWYHPFVVAPGVDYLDAFPMPGGVVLTADFVFEDADHSYETTQHIWRSLKPRLNDNAVLVCHDWFEVAAAGMVKAYREELGEPDYAFVAPPSTCGLAIKRWERHREGASNE